MYSNSKRTPRIKKSILFAIAAVLAIICAVGTTLALLIDTSGPVVNEFEYGSVPIQIDEDIENGVKSNVKVKNIGTVDAYIRAKVIVNWYDKDGNIVVSVPEGYSYELTMADDTTGWFVGSDGFYYYSKKVSPDDSTNGSLLTCKVKYPATQEPEYTLKVDILAQSIQSEPSNVVENEWNVTVNNDGSISKSSN